MKRFLLLPVLALFIAAGLLRAVAADPIAQASRLEELGEFIAASNRLAAALAAPGLTASQRKDLAFEIDRLERIRKDFPLTQEALFNELSKSVRNLTRAEFEQWLKEGRFDAREIDGKRWFMVSSVSNLYWRYPELNPRRIEPKNDAAFQKALWETCVAIKQAAQVGRKPYVLPKRFQMTMTVTAKSNAAPDGEVLRAWLPVPRRYPFQGDFELTGSSSPVKALAPDDSPIRSVLLEQPAKKGAPTEFRIDYRYTAHGVHFDLDPERVRRFDGKDANVTAFTREGPHVVFTPEMKALSARISGGETNPARLAKRFHDWIAENIQYSYAIEYCTIRNISDYCRSRGYGDCGQEALLFITLCRLNGIPARWQSGWHTFPGGKSIHDWAEIYLEPYGWMPVDPYMGIFAMRYATALTSEQRREVRDFFFGGLDQFRMAANSDHSQPLTPSKQALRSDTVDFQRGELEWGSHDLYFDQFSYRLDVEEIPPARRD